MLAWMWGKRKFTTSVSAKNGAATMKITVELNRFTK